MSTLNRREMIQLGATSSLGAMIGAAGAITRRDRSRPSGRSDCRKNADSDADVLDLGPQHRMGSESPGRAHAWIVQ